MNKLIIRHTFRDLGTHYATSFFNKLFDKLSTKYKNTIFEIDECEQYRDMGYGSLCSCMNLSILNPKNNKYILISLFDNWKYHFNTVLGWDPDKMMQFFYAGSFDLLDFYTYKNRVNNNKDFVFPLNIKQIYYPFFYIPCYDDLYDQMTEIFHHRLNFSETIDPRLIFRGYIWDFREKMIDKIKYHEDIIIIDKNINNNNLNYNEFIKELGGYRASLSLPGGTNICHRDIESFAIGIPVFRPLLTTNYPDPLIPNYHYMCFYSMCDYTNEHNPQFLSYLDFQDNLLYWWNTLKNNKEYLDYISINAREWFVKHCTLDNNINYVMSQLNLELLNG